MRVSPLCNDEDILIDSSSSSSSPAALEELFTSRPNSRRVSPLQNNNNNSNNNNDNNNDNNENKENNNSINSNSNDAYDEERCELESICSIEEFNEHLFTSSVALDCITERTTSSWSKLTTNECTSDDDRSCISDPIRHRKHRSLCLTTEGNNNTNNNKDNDNDNNNNNTGNDRLEVLCCADTDWEDDGSPPLVLERDMKRYLENHGFSTGVNLSSAKNPLKNVQLQRRYGSTCDINVVAGTWKSNVDTVMNLQLSRKQWGTSISEIDPHCELHRRWSSRINDIDKVDDDEDGSGKSRWSSVLHKFRNYLPMKSEWKSNLNCIEKNGKNDNWKFKLTTS